MYNPNHNKNCKLLLRLNDRAQQITNYSATSIVEKTFLFDLEEVDGWSKTPRIYNLEVALQSSWETRITISYLLLVTTYYQ